MKKPVTPKSLLAAANALPEPPDDKAILEDYGEVIDVLKYDKCKTWQQVADWLKRRGIYCTKGTAYLAHRKWEAACDAAERDEKAAAKEQP